MAGAFFVFVFLFGYVHGLHDDVNESKRFLEENPDCGCSAEINELRTRLDMLTQGPIAFKAHMTKSISPAANEHIIFDDVQLNLGGAFHEHSSVFLAPYNGTYLFSVSVCSQGNHYIVLDLMRNGSMIGRVLAGDTRYDDCSSETTIAVLSAGDEVFVQHRNTVGDYIHVQGNTVNSFTGTLLQRL